MAFDLSSIRKTRADLPPRVLIYGQHKIGKSTFAAQAEAPIFIATEDGQDALDASAFPRCMQWGDIAQCIGTLYTEEHDFKTVVLDSVDWAEALSHAQVCKNEGKESIEKIGYGKGYLYAADLFREMLEGFDALRKKGMQVILIGHSEIKRFDDPTDESYDRYQLKMHKAVSKLCQEWADVIGFAALQVYTKKSELGGFSGDRTRAVNSGRRVLRLQGGAAWDAGNRFGLPDTIDLNYAAFDAAMKEARSNG